VTSSPHRGAARWHGEGARLRSRKGDGRSARRAELQFRRPRFEITPRPGEFFTGSTQVPRFAVSPDGRAVVYQTQDSKASRFWIRNLDTLDEVSVAGSESTPGGTGRQQPFWSPDGQSIAFFDETDGR